MSYTDYTRHGHVIPGSSLRSEKPRPNIARCGGPGICDICSLDTALYWNKKSPGFDPLPGYHDVIMIAFDITGISAYEAHDNLIGLMPDPDDLTWMDSFWVANDERFDGSDQDSAVFVRKGCQEEARKLLREHGLVD